MLPVIPQDRSVQSLTNTFFPEGLPEGVTFDPVAVACCNFKSNQFGGRRWISDSERRGFR